MTNPPLFGVSVSNQKVTVKAMASDDSNRRHPGDDGNIPDLVAFAASTSKDAPSAGLDGCRA